MQKPGVNGTVSLSHHNLTQPEKKCRRTRIDRRGVAMAAVKPGGLFERALSG